MRRRQSQLSLIVSLIPSVALLSLCKVFVSPLMFTLSFFVFCCGLTVRNTMNGSIKIMRIPQAQMSRVNTLLNAVMAIGQIIGTLVIIPIFIDDAAKGIDFMIAALVFVAVLTFVIFPRQSFVRYIN